MNSLEIAIATVLSLFVYLLVGSVVSGLMFKHFEFKDPSKDLGATVTYTLSWPIWATIVLGFFLYRVVLKFPAKWFGNIASYIYRAGSSS